MANPPHKAERRNLLLQPTSSTGSTPRFNATTSQVTLGHPALVRHEQLLKSKSNLEPQKGYSSKNLRTKKPHQSQSLSFPTQGMWIPIPTGSNSPCRGPKQTGLVTKERARVHGSHQKIPRFDTGWILRGVGNDRRRCRRKGASAGSACSDPPRGRRRRHGPGSDSPGPDPAVEEP